MIRARRAVGRCLGWYGPVRTHWHHQCWYCDRDICAGPQAASYYACSRCWCGESDLPAYIPCDSTFDPDFAASEPSPA